MSPNRGLVWISIIVLLGISCIYLLYRVNALESQYDVLSNDYDVMERRYNDLSDRYDLMEIGYRNNVSYISNHYLKEFHEINNFLNSYSSIPKAFKRVFNQNEVEKIKNQIPPIMSTSSDFMIEAYNYVDFYIRDIEDIDFPNLGFRYSRVNGDIIIEEVILSSNKTYIQTLSYTISSGQGDCEDQAILLYSILKYNFEYVQKIDNKVYLARIFLNDGTGHVSVIVQYPDKNISILDPPLRYPARQKMYPIFISNKANIELENYNSHLFIYSGIKRILLYDIDIVNGNHREAVFGGIEDVIKFLEE